MGLFAGFIEALIERTKKLCAAFCARNVIARAAVATPQDAPGLIPN
jgi:hypothetical protein